MARHLEIARGSRGPGQIKVSPQNKNFPSGLIQMLLLLELLLMLLLLLLYVFHHVHIGGREAPPPTIT